MKELVIYCGGYPEFKLTLYLATLNVPESSVTVIIPSTHPDLLKLFQTVNERLFFNKIKIVCHEIYRAQRARVKGIKKTLYVIPDIVRERRHLKRLLDRHFAGLAGAEVYFSGKACASDRFYLVNKLSRTNRLVHVSAPNDSYLIDESIPKNIVDLAELIVLKLIHGRDIVLGRIPYTKFPSITDKFIKKKAYRIIGLEERDKMLQNLDLGRFKEAFDIRSYSVIYFHDDLQQEGYISNADTFRTELSGIFNILRRHFPENEVARKYHPDYPGDKTMVSYGEVIDDFIPGEFLYSDSVKIYLSLFSCALANVEKGLAVSIANLITFRDNETREQLKAMLVGMGRSKILFPRSLDEFEEILVKCAQAEENNYVKKVYPVET